MGVYLYPSNTETPLKDAYIGEWVDVTSLTLDKSSITLTTVGQTEQITATTVPAGATVNWSSSDTTVATVSSSGLVTCVAPGTCTITAESFGVTATCGVSDGTIVEGYYDMITDSFYSDSNLTTLITPTEGVYYKYIRYTTPVFYKYENGTFKVQKKNATTNTKNTTLALSRSIRRELCTWNGRGVGIVSGQNNSYAQLLKRTDVDTVSVNTEISSVRSHLYAGCGTTQGTIVCGADYTPFNLYTITLDYDNNTISSTDVSSGNSYPSQANTIDKTGAVGYFVDNNSYYVKATINSSGAVSSPTRYSTSSPSNVCGGGWSNGKILVQGHANSSVGVGTLSSDETSISWTTTNNHNLSGANSLGSDRKGFIVVGSYNSSSIVYSFDQGTTWSTMTAQSNTGGQIYVDEIGDIWYTSETNTSVVGWIRFGDFLSESELN